MVTSVVIGIHGLANKPPSDEKKDWWKRAIIEGLKRNCAKTTDELSFTSFIGQIKVSNANRF
jgi:hypothetical protein